MGREVQMDTVLVVDKARLLEILKTGHIHPRAFLIDVDEVELNIQVTARILPAEPDVGIPCRYVEDLGCILKFRNGLKIKVELTVKEQAYLQDLLLDTFE